VPIDVSIVVASFAVVAVVVVAVVSDEYITVDVSS